MDLHAINNNPKGQICRKPVFVITLIGAVILIPLLFFGISCYNSIIAKTEEVDSAWAQVESTCQRRIDLIPNLVKTVSAYIAHEKTTLTEITAARTSQHQQLKILVKELQTESTEKTTSEQLKKTTPTEESRQDFAEKQAKIETIMGNILAVVEGYPNLHGSDQIIALQAQLEGTENRIDRARTTFNRKVEEFNSLIRTYPGRLLAIIFNFQRKLYFQRKKMYNKQRED